MMMLLLVSRFKTSAFPPHHGCNIDLQHHKKNNPCLLLLLNGVEGAFQQNISLLLWLSGECPKEIPQVPCLYHPGSRSVAPLLVPGNFGLMNLIIPCLVVFALFLLLSSQ